MIAPTVNNTLGAYQLGVVIGSILYGVTCVQVYLYYYNSERDSKALKSTIFILWVLDTLHQIFSTIAVYVYAVVNFGDEEALAIPTWSLMASIPPFAVLEIIVKVIFILRIYSISGRKWYLVVPIMVFSLIEFIDVMMFCIRGLIIDSFQGFTKLATTAYIGLGSTALADILIAVIQVVVLWRMRTGFRATDTVVRTLMVYSINTGLLTSICAIATILSFALIPGTLIYSAFYVVLPKLLLNSCLAMLNARRDLRQAMIAPSSLVSIPLGTTASSRTGGLQFAHADEGSGSGEDATQTSIRAKIGYLPCQDVDQGARGGGSLARRDESGHG
ncbi:hypothetical protein CERSUDRAFT_84570 [Gelatoporia subvermispora B]|uniref:DUF6534 domain-containing protein n=1 Tax=Ceriporiopsis subvermispora (strain B) TaxID=914234 RepID=M2RCB5_CERS8|nr:hypothetical protein CERSUDRAFT_84570 [Gelatoporia subvermispora B]